MDIASSSQGIDSITSTIRMTTESTQPPKAPARCRGRAAREAAKVARTPTISVWRLPMSSRESRSRPFGSPPSGWPGWGPGRVGLLADLVREDPLGRVVRGQQGRDEREDDEHHGDAQAGRKIGLRRSRCHAEAMSETPAPSSMAPASSTLAGAVAVALPASASMRCLRRAPGPRRGVVGGSHQGLTRGSMSA